jgi:predicted RNA-binding Zn ribbon-like protein
MEDGPMSSVPAQEPALALAIAFLNTYDALEDPPDFLSVDLVRRLGRKHGIDLEQLAEIDVERLRDLRERLRPVFAEPEPAAKVAALDTVLEAEATGAGLVERDGHIRLHASGGRDPLGAFAVLLADALAQAMATSSPSRFGTCAADPCRCVYVDRTRAARQRYCCELCNDRMAAAAYRRRSSGPARK